MNLGENTNSNNNSSGNNESQKESNGDGIFSFSEMMVIEKDQQPVSTVMEANTEVEQYLSNVVHVNEKTDALIWWREHASMYPRVSELVRKWLAAVSTSTLLERVFSDCGNVLTEKRNRLHDNIIETQVMLKRNFAELNLGPGDLVKMTDRK